MENDTLTDYGRTFEKCADFYAAWTGGCADEDITNLLANGAMNYYAAMREGHWSAATLALEGTLSYVNTEMSSDEYEAYVDMFEDYLSDYD